MRRVIPFACLAALVAVPAAAQTAEERARAAAAASRAKTSDSDTLLNNYVTPGLAGQTIATVDDSKTFSPNIACQKTATMMEVLVQPGSGGDLSTISIARDTDLDGAIDSRTSLPVAVSGICANGVISCQPGTWNQCNFFRWDVDGARNLKLTQVDMPQLSGCYCINNSCGTNLAWGNMASVLRDLGGGMIGALTTADPRYGVAEAVIDGPMIRYVGAQSTACTANPSLPQTAYRATPTAIAADAYSASTGSPVFQALAASQVGVGTALQYRHCTIERQVTVLKPRAEDIISRVSGGYSTIQNGSSFDFLMGSPADNSLGGNCSLIDFRMTLHVGDANSIVDARLSQYFADDWGQVRIDGTLVASGPENWPSMGVPPGKCEQKKTFYRYPNLDLKPWLTPGDHEIWLRVAVAEGGEGFAQVHVDVDGSCRTLEQVVDRCGTIAADPQCRIDRELVDGVQTFINGVATGLRPLAQTRIMGGVSCPTELTRDFFLKDRTYRCKIDDIAQPDTSRGTYIIDHSTETMLADRARQSDGSFVESTRAFSLPDRGSVPACEAICKTRAPKTNNDAALDGVVGNKQNNPTGYDTFYHACDSDNRCPAGPGEEVVSACGCLDDFPEAVVMMQTVRLAGADLVCTGTVR
ncbi:hypothetical protein PX699_22655 [Sphingobium sp. H39-3-25]|uniref:hypothetical protein n=1 Tax=Sphingomonadales TaxID=204457 RepID=UPI000AD377E8|nr:MULTISPECIES: hypothetical protein [Sphingomonadaceae]MDF0491111.1 hypothetical protein [Sphingomonas pollutisoli]MDF0545158.1 hypothetical protein [Sphingobium arseniciresistens]